MKLLAPEALVFAAALPLVILFWLLKRKRVVKLVSSTLLWQRFLAETRASRPLQRLRHHWLLVLQLLLLALVVAALARPFTAGRSQPVQLRVLVLDGSASMQATDVKPSRFEQARAQALQWVEGLRRGEQMMVLLAGAQTEVKQSPTSDKAALRRALQACAVSDAPTRLADALKTAAAFTCVKPSAEAPETVIGDIHLFSDGRASDLDDLANRTLPLVYHRVGERGENAGLVAVGTRPHPEEPGQRAVFATVANASTNARASELELLFEGRLLETRPLELPPTNTVAVAFVVPQTNDGIFTLRLTAADDLAADNQVAVVSLLPQPVQVLLVTRGNRFLERALRAVPQVHLSVTERLTDAAEPFDLVVLDDVTPLVWPRPNLLAIHLAHTNLFPTWSTTPNPVVVDWKNTHSLLRFVNFDNVLIRESLKVQPPDWGVALVDSPETPLLLAGQRQRQRIVWIGFDLLESTWPLLFSFPIFVVNAVEWLNPAATGAAQLALRPGEPFRLGVPAGLGSARLTRPDGQTRTLPLEPAARELVVHDTAQQGIYRLQAGTNQVTFCVNLLDGAETQITPRAELPLGKYAKVQASTSLRADVEYWRWLAALGLAVLLVEWWFYHKRTV